MSIGYKLKRLEAGRVQSDIEQFLNAGGKIETVPFGVSGDPEFKVAPKLAKHIAVDNAREGTGYVRPKIQLEGVVDMYKGGMTLTALAEHFGCSTTTVKARLVEAGVEVRASRNGKTPFDIKYKNLAADWEACKCVDTLAQKYGITPYTMRQTLLRAGIRKQRRRGLTHEQIKEIGELWERKTRLRAERVADYTDVAIAERHGVGKHSVSRIANGGRPAKAVDDETREKIVKDLQRRYWLDREIALLHDDAIGARMGCSGSLVDKVINERRWLL